MAGDSQGLSFGPAAQLYDRVRPGYPAEAVRWALGPVPLRVADLGAGTGKLTRVALSEGHDVVAIDPDVRMLAQLAAATPGIETTVGSAEAVPLADASVDAAIAGQAFHWFDPVRALPEIARVLRPNGVVAIVWNSRDQNHPWIRELATLANRGEHERSHVAHLTSHFTAAERKVFRHEVWMTPDDLLDLVRSRSYYLTASDSEQAWMCDQIRDLCATHPDLAGRDRFAMTYLTSVFRAAKVE